MVAPFSKFYGKIWVGFVLTLESAFFRGFILKPTERARLHETRSELKFHFGVKLHFGAR